MTPQKAQDVLIDAFASLAADHPEWRLELLGEGEAEAALRSRAEGLGVTPRVGFRGLSKDPWKHYSAAGIFVLASRFEGTPNALLEAMSCGLPVIVSDAPGGMRDLIEHDVNGLVVPADDMTALADALRLLINDRERCRRLGEAARTGLSQTGLDRAMATWEQVLGLAPAPTPS